MSTRNPMHGERSQAGFTLIELLIAMTVTLIITGAMYGLLSGGQNAFQREPELTDRQQAIRMGMDRIQRDVMVAGQKMGAFAQAFTDGLNGAGDQPLTGNAGPLTGPNGDTDILEVVGNTGECPDVWIDGTKGVNLEAYQNVPACYPEPGPLMLIYPNGVGKPAWGHNIHAQNKMFNLPLGHQDDSEFSRIFNQKDIECPINRPLGNGEKCPTTETSPTQMAQVMVMRYLIAPDPIDGVPSLWRSSNGGFSDSDVTVSDDPLTAAVDSGWRLIARGVEDLQVQYRNGLSPINVWNDEPGPVDPAGVDYDTIVREVRVTLGARTARRNLAGARSAAVAAAGDAVRGQLVATMTPRAAMFYLSQATTGPGPEWH